MNSLRTSRALGARLVPIRTLKAYAPVICAAVSSHSSSVVAPPKKHRNVSYTSRRVLLPREVVIVETMSCTARAGL